MPIREAPATMNITASPSGVFAPRTRIYPPNPGLHPGYTHPATIQLALFENTDAMLYVDETECEALIAELSEALTRLKARQWGRLEDPPETDLVTTPPTQETAPDPESPQQVIGPMRRHDCATHETYVWSDADLSTDDWCEGCITE